MEIPWIQIIKIEIMFIVEQILLKIFKCRTVFWLCVGSQIRSEQKYFFYSRYDLELGFLFLVNHISRSATKSRLNTKTYGLQTLMTDGKIIFQKSNYIHSQWVKSYICVSNAMNNGCSAGQLWACRNTEKVVGAPTTTFISLIQKYFFDSYVSFAYISNG